VHLEESKTNPKHVPHVVEFRYVRELSLSEIGKWPSGEYGRLRQIMREVLAP
jgi:hypothetical protein